MPDFDDYEYEDESLEDLSEESEEEIPMMRLQVRLVPMWRGIYHNYTDVAGHIS